MMLVLWLAAWSAERPHPLQSERYAFCHRVGANGADVEEWCDLVEEVPASVCPEMHETCAQEAFTSGCLEGGEGSKRRGLAGDPGDEVDAPSLEGWDELGCSGCEGSERGCEGPKGRGLPAAVRWAVALALAVLLVAGIRVLLQLRRRAEPTLRPADALADLPMADDGLPALPHEALLAAARAALAEGRIADAVALSRAAALRGLGADGALILHPSRTDREYVRALRGDRREALAEVVGAAEAVRWEGRLPDAARAAAVLARAAWLLGAAAALLVALPARASERHGPWGDAAIIELYRAEGFDVDLGLASLSDLSPEVHVLLLDLTRVAPSDDDVAAMMTWAAEGGILIVAGDPTELPELLWTQAAWVGDATVTMAGPLADMAPPRLPRGPFAQICGEGAAWAAGAPADEESCSGALILHQTFGSGHAVAIADSRLLANAAMIDEGNAEIVRSLLRRGEAAGLWELPAPTRVAFALVSTTFTAATAVADARLVPFVLHVLAVWALLVWGWGVPALPLAAPAVAARRDAVEHATALGRRWAATRDVAWAARSYVRMWWQRLDGAGLGELARRRGRSAAEAEKIEADARAMVRGAPFPKEDARNLVEELWKLTRRDR
jgi:hypothetical protein